MTFNIEFDYRFDDKGFFNDPTRKSTLEYAAGIWESYLNDDFTTVPAGTKISVPIFGNSSSSRSITLSQPIDDLVIFTYGRPVADFDYSPFDPFNPVQITLGQGGPFALEGSLDRFNDNDFEPRLGSMLFNANKSQQFFFDTTPQNDDDIPKNQYDFLTIALHEIGHVLGIGTAPSFKRQVSGNGFNGSLSRSLNGGNPIPLTSDSGHIQEGFTLSPPADVLMGPTLIRGERHLPSPLDLALLADIGYQVAAFFTIDDQVNLTEGDNGIANATFTVTRMGAATNPFTVNFATADGTATGGSDYTPTSGALTFATNETTKTITVPIIGDTNFETDETFFLNLANTTNTTFVVAQGRGTITNNDLPSITLVVSPERVNEDDDTNLVYTFTRSGPVTSALTVKYRITGTNSGSSDYRGAGFGDGSITFVSGSSTATLTLDPIADNRVESDETIDLTLVSSPKYSIGTTNPVTGIITNDDVPPIIILSVSPERVNEDDDTNLVYTFTRSGPVTSALNVSYRITGTANAIGSLRIDSSGRVDSPDYREVGAGFGGARAITFASGSSTATLTLDPIADNRVESDETIDLTLVSSPMYSIGTTNPVTGIITNDDILTSSELLNKLNTGFTRFQNTGVPGTYLFAGPGEAANIRRNFRGFKEEGLAFQVGVEPNDELLRFTRFQNTQRPGTYLFAGPDEAANIRQNFPNFKEEGVAFYALDSSRNLGTQIYRFQNTSVPGTYLFAGPTEKDNILANFPNFRLEGEAFEVVG